MATPPSVDAWRAAGTYVRWREHTIFARVDGPRGAPPLVLIHGFPTASWDWWPLWDALAADYRVVACDLLGLGLSAKPRGRYSVMAQADLVEAVAAWAGVTRAAVLAHDYGDTVAQELLARQREGGALRLTGVAFLNGGLFPEAHRARPIQQLLASPLGPLVARLSSHRTFVRSMRAIAGDHPPSDAELDVLWQLASRDGGVRAMPGLLGYLAERRRHRARWVGALIDSPVPLRLIDGLADPVSGAHMATRYRELVPRADVVELPGVGHYPQLEAPAAVLAAVAPFLATCATTAP
ncbi:MAG: alpha/beta hydrolase [Myxococcales bacterium]|nr:alpha/beta hydrolase [Myxococcales bacterium]MBP6846876.1 alpha/beta hydrolase [Kofleriaceae bacterium]